MLYQSETDNFKIALAGDCMPTRRLSVFREERFLKLRDIFCEADVGFAHLESTVHNFLEGHLNLNGGTYITTEPSLLEDIKWFGINALSCAGSHSFDYGEEGILRTIQCLDKVGIIHAGSGRHLREARSPAYVDAPRGRFGLIATTAHLFEWAVAGEQRPDTTGRPGVSPLRYSTTYTVDSQGMKELRRLGTALGGEAAKKRKTYLGVPTASDARTTYDFLGRNFEIGDSFSIRTKPNDQDLIQIIRQVQEARAMADWVGVSLHYHERGGTTYLTAQLRSGIEEPADFVYEFARRCIDEGADIFIGHGPQVPLGIEIYKNKPIFYSLGSFIFQLETNRYLPQEAYARYGLDDRATPADFVKARYQNDTKGHPADPLQWQQMCALCQYREGKLNEIKLVPLDLGFGKPRSQRGRPLLADEQLGKKIISRVATLSKRYGTEVSFSNGHGVIEIG